MGEVHGWRVLKSVYQDSLSLMSGVGVLPRATQGSHATSLNPRLSSVQQRPGYFIVLNHFKEAKEANSSAMVLIEPLVDGGRYSACQFAIPPCQEVCYFGVAVVGMFSPQEPNHAQKAISEQVSFQWRSPTRITSIESPRQLSKVL